MVDSSVITPGTVHVAFAISFVGAMALAFGHKLFPAGKSDASSKTGPAQTPQFLAFQRTYIGVYLLMMAGDWLQGPYMYALYDAYGFKHEEIAALFVAGFGSSMLFGTVAGSLADTLGRKRGALAYVVVYAASCVTKHWRSYEVLMFGRILGGIATSLLFSVFESWLVAEHAKRGFEPSWLSSTFANAQAGNSIVAIVSGVFGEWLAAQKPLTVLVPGTSGGAEGGDAPAVDGAIMVGGYCAPFDAAAVFLLIGGAVILTTWTENYGDMSAGSSSDGLKESLTRGLALLARDRRVLLVGLVTSCFEAAMYAFVFEWTPALTAPDAPRPPYGEIFAAMMMCCAGGTRLFGMLCERKEPQDFARPLFALAAVAMAAPVLSPTNRLLGLVAFLVFEGVVGCYFPALGTLKSKIIPDAQRSTIYNLFRVPLNVLVLLVLLSKLPTQMVFTAAASLLLAAAVLQHLLFGAMKSYRVQTEFDREPLVSV
mmetsp:Transcript_10869/g.32951  ORF Transcript_10869/g.32951 Transcript_10869/m.32951 type:complete len:483 (+) Transcript_10869:123-1571(+)